jgi:hypothetical protein
MWSKQGLDAAADDGTAWLFKKPWTVRRNHIALGSTEHKLLLLLPCLSAGNDLMVIFIEIFNTFIGVLQGDTLTSFLFIIVFDCILTWLLPYRYPSVTVTDLDFTDDLVLLSNTMLHSVQHDLEVAAKQVGHIMNASKTEFMSINIDNEEPAIKSQLGHWSFPWTFARFWVPQIIRCRQQERFLQPERHCLNCLYQTARAMNLWAWHLWATYGQIF